MLRTIWAARAEELGEVPVVRRSRGGVSLPAVPSALEIAWQAMRHLEERQSVFAAHHLEVADHERILEVAGWISPATWTWIEHHSRVPTVLKNARGAGDIRFLPVAARGSVIYRIV